MQKTANISDINENFKVGSIIHPSNVGLLGMAQCVKKVLREIL